MNFQYLAYAVQIDRMDQGIGTIIETLEARNEAVNTMILFLCDNGGCAETISATWAKRLFELDAARQKTRDGQTVRVVDEIQNYNYLPVGATGSLRTKM